MDSTQIGIFIGLKTAGFGALSGNVSKLNALSSSLEKAGRNVTKLNEKISKIKDLKLGIDSNISKIGGELSNWQSRLAGAAGFALPVKLAIDDEAAFANVKKYVDDSEENLLKLKHEMKTLSNELGESFSNLSSIAAGGGKINLAGEELVKYTRLLATGSTAFEMSADEVATAANNMKVGFKLDKVDGLKEFFDVVNLLDNKVTNAGAADILTATSLTAGNANLLGLNEKAASAIAASMLSTGKAPSVVGTSLNSLYTRLANVDNQGKKFHEALATIGLDAGYLKTAIGKDAAGAVTLFLDRIAAAPKELQAGLLYDLMGGNFSDEIAGLITNMDAFKANMKMAFSDEAAGSMQKELQVKLNTTKSSLERLAQAWRNIGSSIGEAFLPTLKLLTSALNSIASGMSWFIKEHPEISKFVFGLAGGLLAFVTLAPAVKILAWSLGIVWQQAKILGTAFSLLKEVFKLKYLNTLKLNAAYLITAARMKAATAATWIANSAGKAWTATMAAVRGASLAAAAGMKIMRLALISTGIGALVVALGAGAAWIIENWDKVKAFFGNIWESVKPYWEATSNFFSSIFDSVVEWWRSIFGGFFDWVSEKFQWVVDIVSSIGDALGVATDWTKDALGIGDGKESNWYNPFSWFNDEEPQSAPVKAKEVLSAASKPASPQAAALAATASGANINISFNGDFLLNSNNGKFDLESFKDQITRGVKEALKRDEFNSANTEIREQR